MKLDRNKNADGHGKYALLNLRTNRIEWGAVGDSNEFFVIKLKDRYAKVAFQAYADAVVKDANLMIADIGPDNAYANGLLEWGFEIDELARRAGPNHPDCKRPD